MTEALTFFPGEKQSASKNSFSRIYTPCKAESGGVKFQVLALSFLSICGERLSKLTDEEKMEGRQTQRRVADIIAYSYISVEPEPIPACTGHRAGKFPRHQVTS